ncbi:ABC transporter [Trinickia violacea]|uniref:ABC transporter n=1 Tax=Trinickia violacea TaxID=2571746 RepID=A0A4P8IZ21_9BURK|nr:AarF/UbiB family protein [Trinickia violacea]QCP53265.1 ABC transporter [Trinickia violacea]
MRTLFRRLSLLFCILRYGARLLWLAAPQDHKLHWFATLVKGMHEAGGARSSLHRALPQLGPLASAFAESLGEHPELATHTLHDAIDAVSRLEAPLSPEQSEHALKGAFGRPLADLFAEINLVPVQSGFAEQIHVARLAVPESGHKDVVIKLLRMQQVQQIGDEAALLCWAARLIEKFSPAARKLKVHALAESFAADILRRFDPRAEAANLSQSGRHFEGDARLVVPDVIWDLVTPSTLVTQRIDTLAATDIDGLHAHHVNVARLAAHIVEVIAQQAFEHGFFHAALDARRVRVSIEPATLGRLVLVDFSIMSSLSAPEREFFVHGATALFEQDYARIADMHRDAGHVPHTTRTEVLEAELRRRSEAHFAADVQERSASGLLQHLLGAAHAFDGEVSPRLVAAQYSLAQAEALARTLHPGVDTWRIAKEVLGEIARKDLDHRGWIKRLSQELPHLAHIVPRLPQLVMRRLQQHHDRHRSSFDTVAWAHELQREYRRTRVLVWACVVCGGLLGAGAVWLTH